jgi:hypothetical protein
MSDKALLVKCPGCGQSAAYSTRNPWRPFCSERCRQNDLGGWATEQFRIPATAAASIEDGDADENEPADATRPERRLR